MSRPNKTKIPTDAAAPGTGLFQAFAALDVSGLPPRPEPSSNPTTKQAEAGKANPAKMGRAVLRRETAHRAGKCVVVIDGFDEAHDSTFLEALAKRLRAECGCGGALKDRSIELQGDQVARIRALLQKEGFKVAGIS